jgi:hypothetical protein
MQINNVGSLEQYWNEQIILKRESGLSRAAYCKKHDLSYHQFGYWEQKHTQPEPTQLLPVKLVSSINSGCQQTRTLCTLMLKSGAQLKVHDTAVIPVLVSLLN